MCVYGHLVAIQVRIYAHVYTRAYRCKCVSVLFWESVGRCRRAALAGGGSHTPGMGAFGGCAWTVQADYGENAERHVQCTIQVFQDAQ